MRVLRGIIVLHDRLPPAARERAVCCATIGSMNTDPVSARSRGEVLPVVAGPASLIAFLDFFQLAEASTWLTIQAELDALIPPYGRCTRWLTHRS